MKSRDPRATFRGTLRLKWTFGFRTLCLYGLYAMSSRADAASTYPAPHYTQHIGAQLPLHLSFTDDRGQIVSLSDFTRQGPIVLLFGYWHCPQLCSVVSAAAVDALRQLRSEPANQFSFIYVSIDKTDTPRDAASAKSTDLRHFTHEIAAERWHYLVGSENSVRAFATAAGFDFRYDTISKQYAHPAGLVVLTPTGRVSQYFLGVDFRAGDLAAALHTAASEHSGSTVYDLVLLCFRGDGISGRYGKVIWHVLQCCVGVTVLTLGVSITRMLRHEKYSTGRKFSA